MVPLLLHLQRHRDHNSLHRLHHLLKHFTTTTTTPPHVPLRHPTYQIWSSNTSLGKTLVSTGLAASFLLSSHSRSKFIFPKNKFLYLKPIQTGFPSDSDSSFVYSKLSSLSLLRNIPLVSSNSVLFSSLPAATSLFPDKFGSQTPGGTVNLDFYEERKNLNISECPELVCKTLFAWKEAVSPHLAERRENANVGDSVIVEMLEKCLREGLEGEKRDSMDVFCVVETAGGVASPGTSSWILQCDLYRYAIVFVI